MSCVPCWCPYLKMNKTGIWLIIYFSTWTNFIAEASPAFACLFAPNVTVSYVGWQSKFCIQKNYNNNLRIPKRKKERRTSDTIYFQPTQSVLSLPATDRTKKWAAMPLHQGSRSLGAIHSLECQFSNIMVHSKDFKIEWPGFESWHHHLLLFHLSSF